METKANERDLKEGNRNTKYFHPKASARKKKNYISLMYKDGVEITHEDNLVKHIIGFYKDFFWRA